MGSLGLLIAMDCIMIIAVLILGFAAAFAAYYCTASPLYTTEDKVKSAHKLLTWIAVLGIVLFAIILTVSIVVGIKGKHKEHFEISNKSLTLANKDLTKHHKTSWLVISLLIINIIVFLSLGVVGVVSALDLQSFANDDNISKAYSASIYIAVAGLVGGVIGVIAIIMCFTHKDKYEKKHEEVTRPLRPPPPPPSDVQNSQNLQDIKTSSKVQTPSNVQNSSSTIFTQENLDKVSGLASSAAGAIGKFISS